MNGLTIFMASMLLSLSKPDCTCGNTDWSVKRFLKVADIVLVGTIDTVSEPYIIGIDTIVDAKGDTIIRAWHQNDRLIIMNIESYYNCSKRIKLKTDKSIIRTGSGWGDCGYWFVQGERYIVWGVGFRDQDSVVSVHTSICTLTGKWNTEHIKAIEKHRKRRKLKD